MKKPKSKWRNFLEILFELSLPLISLGYLLFSTFIIECILSIFHLT